MTCIWLYVWFCVRYWPKQMEWEVWIASAIACQHFSLSHSLSVSPVDETCGEHVQPFQPQQLWVNEPKHLKQVCVSMFFGRGECVWMWQRTREKNCVCVCVCHCVGTSLTAQVGQMETYTNYQTAQLRKDLHRHKKERVCAGTMTLENGCKMRAL